jgi:hypothetical protein
VTEQNTTARQVTPVEGRLAQAYTETMDFVSRCAQAIAAGDWDYLADKAGDLRNRVEQLETTAAAAAAAKVPSARADAVLAEVVSRGGSYRAVKALHATALPPGTHRPAGGPQ